jgi:hypothetical protein
MKRELNNSKILNMSNLKYIICLITACFLASCSSDSAEDVRNPEGLFFNYSVDGESVAIQNWQAQRSENTITIIGLADNGTAIEMDFNTAGNLGTAWAYNVNNIAERKGNFYYNKKYYFDFQLLEVDPVNQDVTVNFSGRVYTNQYDLNSSYSTVQGSFKLGYGLVAPITSGLKVSAKVNGTAWNATNQYEGGIGYQALSFVSDDEYVISFVMPNDATTVGNNGFNEASLYNKVVLYKYNVDSQQLEEYISTSGTFNITAQNQSSNSNLIEGTFTLNATHPQTGAVVSVTDGAFKTLY